MSAVAPKGHVPVATARDAAISDVKYATDQLNAAVNSFATSNGGVSDATDKTQRQQVIDAAQRVLNAVKRPDDVWVDSELFSAPYHPS